MKKNFTNYIEQNFDFLDDIKNLRHKSANKGEIIYAHKFKFIAITKGSAKLNLLEGNKELIFDFINTGNYAFIDANTMLEFLTNGKYLELSIHQIYAAIRNNKIAVSVINALLRSLYIQRFMIKEIVFFKLEDRIFYFMKNISDEENIVKLPFNITVFANILGSSRQNVSLGLSNLEKDEKIRKISPRKYEILVIN